MRSHKILHIPSGEYLVRIKREYELSNTYWLESKAPKTTFFLNESLEYIFNDRIDIESLLQDISTDLNLITEETLTMAEFEIIYV